MNSRRHFLKFTAGASLTLLAPSTLAKIKPLPERRLQFYHLHTGEKLTATYWQEGHYIAEQLDSINHLLRDHRSGELATMDKNLLDLLFALQKSLGHEGAYQIISAYRSPKTNAMLRNKSKGVAKRSLHMQGKAIDIRLAGADLKDLRRAAVDLRAGGVGYYPKSDFIHVDTGRPRYW